MSIINYKWQNQGLKVHKYKTQKIGKERENSYQKNEEVLQMKGTHRHMEA